MRCQKCNGCVSSFDEYKPKWCKDKNCPQGGAMPEDLRKEQEEWLDAVFAGKNRICVTSKQPKLKK